MTAEQLAAVDFGAQAKTTSEITAEEAARLVSSEVKAIEAKKVIEQQTLDAEQAQQIADLQAQQIRDLQAAEVARRANEVDAPKLTETLGGKFAVGLAKAAVEVGLATAAPVIGPIVRGLVL